MSDSLAFARWAAESKNCTRSCEKQFSCFEIGFSDDAVLEAAPATFALGLTGRFRELDKAVGLISLLASEPLAG